MLDANTKKACKDDPSIREIKIRNIEHAIEQAELMIKESKMTQEELIILLLASLTGQKHMKIGGIRMTQADSNIYC